MRDAGSPVEFTRAGRVATIVLSRPDALNAITREMLIALGAALDDVASDDRTKVVVLTGRGRAFSAGVDLKELGERKLSFGSIGEYLDGPARDVIRKLTTIPKVVIARVNGFCFTGALEIVLACDLVVAAAEAKMGDTHAKWGLRPSWGMSQRLVRAVGINRARDLSYTARTFTGAEAAEWGLAARAVPLADLDQAVDDLVADILSNSQDSVAAYKDLFRHALDDGLAAGIAYEEGTQYPILDTEERLAEFRR